MSSVEDQQIQICLLKCNLEEIENILSSTNSALPSLNAENEVRSKEIMTLVYIFRNHKSEVEKLKMEKVRLTAKRLNLKKQYDEMNKNLKKVIKNRAEMEKSKNDVEQEDELEMLKYEAYLKENAEQYRKTHYFYDADAVNRETETFNAEIEQLDRDVLIKQGHMDILKKQQGALQPDVPEDLLTILGKHEQDKRIEALTYKYNDLQEEKNQLIISEIPTKDY